MARPASLLYVVLAGLAVAGGTPAWVTQEDLDLASQAREAKERLCGRPRSGRREYKGGGRSILEKGVGAASGGDNIVLTVLSTADSPEELEAVWQEEALSETMWLLSKTYPLVVMLLLSLVWLGCCWTAFPCCRCCRLCVSKGAATRFCKAAAFLVGIALAIALVIPVGMADRAYDIAVDGFDDSACAAATLSDTVVSGQEEFIGMVPVLQVLQKLYDNLEASSPMMTEVRAALEKTSSVPVALYLASETLKVLQDALGENLPAELESELHTCEFCVQITPLLRDATSALDSGAASAMDGVRREIDAQLSDERIADLRLSFTQAADPLAKVMDNVAEKMRPVTQEATFTETRGWLEGQRSPGRLVVLVQVVLAGSLSVCMLMALLACCCCDRSENNGPSGAAVRYSRCLGACSLCTWCYAWLVAVVAFFLGGVFTFASVPLSGTCLLLDDMNVPLLRNISAGIGLDLNVNSTDMLMDVFDQCFFNDDATSSPSLMDIVRVDSNGTQLTLREMAVDSLQREMLAEFDNLAGKMQSQGLDQTASVATLVAVLRDDPVKGLIVTNATAAQEDASCAGLAENAGTAAALVSSVMCSDFTVSQGIPGLNGTVVPGVESLVDAVAALGTRRAPGPSDGCAVVVDCADASGATADSRACLAGNYLVSRKRGVRALTNFRCDLFAHPQTGALCDPLDMVAVPTSNSSTAWTGDCLSDTGKLTRVERLCDLEEFTTYIQSFSGRIEYVFSRVDTVVSQLLPTLNSDLRGTVETYLVQPIDEVADGAKCRFLAKTYDDLINGFCYQTVASIVVISHSYVACGALSFAAAVFMYFLWRRAADNVALDRCLVQDEAALQTDDPAQA